MMHWGGIRGAAGGAEVVAGGTSVPLLGLSSPHALLQPHCVGVEVALEDGAGADEGSLQGAHEAAHTQILPWKRAGGGDGGRGDPQAANVLCGGRHCRQPPPAFQLPPRNPQGRASSCPAKINPRGARRRHPGAGGGPSSGTIQLRLDVLLRHPMAGRQLVPLFHCRIKGFLHPHPTFPGVTSSEVASGGTCQVEVGDSRLCPHTGDGLGLQAAYAVVDAVYLPPGAGEVVLVGDGRPTGEVPDLGETARLRNRCLAVLQEAGLVWDRPGRVPLGGGSANFGPKIVLEDYNSPLALALPCQEVSAMGWCWTSHPADPDSAPTFAGWGQVDGTGEKGGPRLPR